MKLPTYLVLLLVLFCGFSSVESLEMIGTNVRVSTEAGTLSLGPKHRVYSKITSLTVRCHLKDSSDLASPKITWYKKEDRPDALTSDAFYTVSSNSINSSSYESRLTVAKNSLGADTNFSTYVCIGNSGSQVANSTVGFESIPLLSISISGGSDNVGHFGYWILFTMPDLLVEPGKATNISCSAAGHPNSSPMWYREDAGGEETGMNVSILEFPSPSYEKDRGFYVCRATNSYGDNAIRIYLRVKDPKAYLVPVIIVALLIVILVTIIVVDQILLHIKKTVRAEEFEESAESDQYIQAAAVVA